jgi:hypothetical protein
MASTERLSGNRKRSDQIPEQTRQSIEAWIRTYALETSDYLFPGQFHDYLFPCLSARQYHRLVLRWISSIEPEHTA